MPEQTQIQHEGLIRRGLATLVFWWLTGMGTVTLALVATIPMWIEYKQVVRVRDELRSHTDGLQNTIRRNDYLIKAYTEDPEAVDMLAVTDLRYRRPDEMVMPLPGNVVSQISTTRWGMPAPSPAARADTPAPKDPDRMNRVERLVERAKGLSRHHLGPARSIALVEMFSDAACRKALTAGALAVLAAALFLCKSGVPGRQN